MSGYKILPGIALYLALFLLTAAISFADSDNNRVNTSPNSNNYQPNSFDVSRVGSLSMQSANNSIMNQSTKQIEQGLFSKIQSNINRVNSSLNSQIYNQNSFSPQQADFIQDVNLVLPVGPASNNISRTNIIPDSTVSLPAAIPAENNSYKEPAAQQPYQEKN